MMMRWLAVWLVAVGVPVWAQDRPQVRDRFPVTARQVAETVSGRGVKITEDQVSLLASVSTSTEQPDFNVLSVQPFGDRANHKSLVKLGCRQQGNCLPFYAVVGYPDQPGVGGASVSAPQQQMLKPDAAVLMRAGTRAILMIDDGRSRIRITVVTMENGILGHKIRVASPDRKQFYTAEVVGVGVLRGSL